MFRHETCRTKKGQHGSADTFTMSDVNWTHPFIFYNCFTLVEVLSLE